MILSIRSIKETDETEYPVQSLRSLLHLSVPIKTGLSIYTIEISRSHPSFIRSCHYCYQDVIDCSGNDVIWEAGNSCGSTLISIWHFLSCPWSEPATAADIIFCVFFPLPILICRLLPLISVTTVYAALHHSGEQDTFLQLRSGAILTSSWD